MSINLIGWYQRLHGLDAESGKRDELYDALVVLKERYPESIPIINRWGVEYGGRLGPVYRDTSGNGI